jgi:hypothetical protein
VAILLLSLSGLWPRSPTFADWRWFPLLRSFQERLGTLVPYCPASSSACSDHDQADHTLHKAWRNTARCEQKIDRHEDPLRVDRSATDSDRQSGSLVEK